MNLKTELKKRWLSILFYSLIIVLIFSPDAKSWLLQQVVSSGLLKAEIKKDSNNISQATSFSFIDSNGKTTATADLRGKVVFINFWASWCPPCRAEMPSLENLYQKLKGDDNFVFLFMNEDEDRNKAIQYLKKNSFTIPLYYSSGIVPREVFSGSLPTTIVLNKEGKIVLKHQGMAGYDTNDFIRQLKEL
ncbi:MAG: TlpA disulfide reductase family protein [Ginsengibacter sp.]